MKRREFIQYSGVLSAAVLMPVSCLSVPSRGNYPMGLQLYTVRDAMELDPIGTLTRLKDMGYTHFESYGFDTVKGTYYGMKPSIFKAQLDALDLATTSGHYGFADQFDLTAQALMDYTDRCIEGATALNDPYIVWPILRPAQHTLEGYKQLAEKLNLIGARCKASGIGFAYHNFGYDFDLYDGIMGYDVVLNETQADLVQMEVDFYWVMHAGVLTPKELIEKAPGRFPLWHIKDMDKITRDYTEMGNGSIDYTSLLPDPKRAGLQHYYVEQGGNFAVNSMQSVDQSAQYVQRELLHLL